MKILIATDGSAFSMAAIDACRNIIADPKHTSIKLISVTEDPTPIGPDPFTTSEEYPNEMERVLNQQAKNILEQAESHIKTTFSEPVSDLTTEVVMGSPARVIVNRAREWEADLIVVGSHGAGFWSRMLLGSVSNSVVHHAPCSVLVARGEADLSDPA